MTREEDDDDADGDAPLPDNLQANYVAVVSLDAAKDLASRIGSSLTPRARLAVLTRARTLARGAVSDLTLAILQARYEIGEKQ